MRVFIEPAREQWASLTTRVTRDDSMLEWRVAEILGSIRSGGEQALREVVRSIDGFAPLSFKVTPEEFEEAERLVPDDLKEAIQLAASRIRSFHELEKPTDIEWDDGRGIVCRRKFLPLKRVGLYKANNSGCRD